MTMLHWGTLLSVSTLVAAAAGDAAAGMLEPVDTWAGEACRADSSFEDGDCDPWEQASSFRQLRASSTSDALRDSHAANASEDRPEQHDDVLGLPGGWGEAAAYLHSNTGKHPEGFSSSLGSSCTRYGCGNHYIRGRSCQCNPACRRHNSCCHDFEALCRHSHHRPHESRRRRIIRPPRPIMLGKTLTLYHQTNHWACKIIVKTGFRLGRQGWCGGGIYFAMSKDATETKAIGPDSAKGCFLQARVNVGHVHHLTPHCDRKMTADKIHAMGYDSISFDPGDGREYVLYDATRISHIKIIH